MSKHTPGPWHLMESGNMAANETRNGANGWVGPICRMANEETMPQSYRSISHEELVYNARLIAAAPEMLEALKAMRREFINNGIDGLSTRQAAALDNAAYVIAKAEGK